MSLEQPVEELDDDLATAFGLYALTDADLHEAAEAADVAVLELELAIERAGLDDVFEPDGDCDLSETIDELLGE